MTAMKSPLLHPLIEIRDLTHRFPDGTPGLSHVNLTFHEGSFVVIAGANGSGKTTLLKHLNALLLPTHGTVRVDGEDTRKNPLFIRQKVGLVFQNPDQQIVGETVYDDTAFGPENLMLDRRRVRERVRTALRAVSLSEKAEQPPHLLSGGEKRRLAIAGILAMKPRVLALDEPFSSLDYPGIREVLRQVLALHRLGATVIVTTHDVEKIIAHAERLVVMQKGTVAADGPPDQIASGLERFGVRVPCAFRWGRRAESWLD